MAAERTSVCEQVGPCLLAAFLFHPLLKPSLWRTHVCEQVGPCLASCCFLILETKEESEGPTRAKFNPASRFFLRISCMRSLEATHVRRSLTLPFASQPRLRAPESKVCIPHMICACNSNPAWRLAALASAA